MASRPTVTILGADGKATQATHTFPTVFTAPIRPDIVQEVHKGIAKNKRQPYAVSEKAGHQTSAESWGTGQYFGHAAQHRTQVLEGVRVEKRSGEIGGKIRGREVDQQALSLCRRQ
jgi:ribosomal protein L4